MRVGQSDPAPKRKARGINPRASSSALLGLLLAPASGTTAGSAPRAASERTNGLASFAAASCSAGPGHRRVRVDLAQRPRRPLADDRRGVVLQRASPARSSPLASWNMPSVVAASARTLGVAVAEQRRHRAAVAQARDRLQRLHRRHLHHAVVHRQRRRSAARPPPAARSGPAPAPCAPAPRSRTPGSTAPPTAPGSTTRSGTRPARPPRCARRPSRAAPAGSASATRTFRATPRRASHQAATCRMPWSWLSISGITMSTQETQTRCSARSSSDLMASGDPDAMASWTACGLDPLTGDRASGRRQRDAQERDDCELHCLVRVHVDFSVTGCPSQRCSGSRGRRTDHPCRCSG